MNNMTYFFSSLLAILYYSQLLFILGSIVKGCEEGAHPLSSVIHNIKYYSRIIND